MKKTLFSLIVFLMAGSMFAQTSFLTKGNKVTYDTTGQFAATTLVGSLGYLKYVGSIDMRDGVNFADSISLFVSFSDSVQAAFYAMPISAHKTPTIADTVGRATPAGLHLWHIQNGAGHVSIPWFRLRAGLSDLVVKGSTIRIYVWISKVAGLTTYGTATAGKAVQQMNVQALKYY